MRGPITPVLVVLAACSAPPTRTEGGTTAQAAPAPPVAPLPPGPAEKSDAGRDGGEALADPLAIFLEAAQTNLERPFPAGTRESNRRYYEAAQLLPEGERPGMLPAEDLVPTVLGRSKDPRAAAALAAWARRPAPRPSMTRLLQAMTSHPKDVYLDVVESILANPDLAGEVQVGSFRGFAGVLHVGAQISTYELAIDLAAQLPGHDGRALVERIARDRTASEPNPRILAALKCEAGQIRVDDEARALSSLRLMALAALEDRALWEKIGADPSEHPLVRTWVRRFSQGRPHELRWRHHEKETLFRYERELDAMPCIGTFPGKRRPYPPKWESPF